MNSFWPGWKNEFKRAGRIVFLRAHLRLNRSKFSAEREGKKPRRFSLLFSICWARWVGLGAPNFPPHDLVTVGVKCVNSGDGNPSYRL